MKSRLHRNHACGLRRSLQRRRKPRGTAKLNQAAAIRPHLRIIRERRSYGGQYAGGLRVHRRREPVVHPLALTPGSNDSSPPQVSQMAGDFGLAHPQGLDQKADANFVVADQVKEPEPRTVGNRPKKQLHPEAHGFLGPHKQAP